MKRGKRWRRPRLDAPEAIGMVIDRSGEDRFASHRAPIAEHAWRRAVGARIADRAKPISLENGTLIIKVATSAWAHELSLMKTDLLKPLAAYGVKDIRFRVGAVEPAQRAPEQRKSRAVPKPAALSGELAASVAAIEDPELRELIALAAGSSIAWQEHTEQRKKEPPPKKKR
jgi:predicted nucleic acid-binding Zn ribbon protein